MLNATDLEGVWGEDETIGWVYQFFNSGDERKRMRDESQAPRNSRGGSGTRGTTTSPPEPPGGPLHRRDAEDLADVKDVRQGKFFEVELEGSDATTAKARVTEMADKLLANPVIESYRVEIL